MKFKSDENLPDEVSGMLVEAGHDASSVLEEKMGGEPDPNVMRACLREGRALVTLDLGFADIRTYPPEEHHGVIVLRPKRQSKPSVLAMFVRILPLLEMEPLTKRLWIVEEERVRLRS